MKVLHAIAPAPVGGLEEVVAALMAGHVELGLRVDAVLVLNQIVTAEHYLVDRLRSAGCGVYPIQLPPRSYRRERESLKALCMKLKPDVVHTHGYRPDVVDAPAARELGIPTITTVHGFAGGGLKNRVYEHLQRRAFRRFDAVVAVSHPIHARLARDGLSPVRLRCEPNAWFGETTDLDKLAARHALGLPADGLRIGFVGRLSREKGADLFVEMLGRLRDLPVKASVVGEGRTRSSLEARAKALGVGDRITWHGLVRDAGRFMPAFDGLVLSSRTEGTPIVLFEAMAARTPVIAAAVGGVPDVVGPEEAILVSPDPKQLASAVRLLLGNQESARARAERAAQKLKTRFAREPWLRRYWTIYEEVIADLSADPPLGN